MTLTIGSIAFATLLSTNIAWGNPVDDRELLCMTHAIYHEAATEPTYGKVAVANLIRNRVEHRRFPETYCAVVKQPSQFSYILWEHRRHIKINNHIDYKAFEESLIVALTVMTNSVQDTTSGSTHYLNKSIVTRLPNWYSEAEKVGKFGNHHFVKLER